MQVKLDTLGDSLGASVTSTLITTAPVVAAEKPAEQAADEVKPIEPTATEVEEPMSDAAANVQTKTDAAVSSDEAKLDTAVATETEKPMSDAATNDEAKPEVPVTSEMPQPATAVETLDAADADLSPTTESLPVVADVAEPVMEASEPMSLTSDPIELPIEQDPVTERSMDAVVITAPETQMSDVSADNDLVQFSLNSTSTELLSLDNPNAKHHKTHLPTPYSPTCAYIPNASFIGFTLYALINIGSPFECGSKHCSADWQCTHWNWHPSKNGTCEIKSNPGSGWMWAKPTKHSPTHKPSRWCGFIPKRACPPALISICIYIDILISLF